MSTLNTPRNRGAEIFALVAKHGASNVCLFGSAIRGEDQENSDENLLVDTQVTRNLLDLIGLQQDIETIPGKKVDVLPPNGINHYLKERILGEATSL